MKRAIVIVAVALLGFAGLGLIAAQGGGGGLEPPTLENPVVICGGAMGDYPFATNEAGQRRPISVEECNRWIGLELSEAGR